MGKRAGVEGKAVLVTGAARGVGAEAAKLLAARGARLALVGLEPERLHALARELGGATRAYEADVSDAAAVQRAVERAVEHLGGLDVAVSNAGIAGFGPLATFDPGQFERTFAVNLMGTWHVMRACLPQLIGRRGYFIANASIAAGLSAPGMGAYSASKAAVESLCDTLRREVAHRGVDVGVAYFSWLATDLVSEAETNPGFSFMRAQLPGFARAAMPVSVAAAALVEAIEQRSARLVLPKAILPMLALRWPVALYGAKQVARIMPELERLCSQAIARAGGADKAPFTDPRTHPSP